MAPGLSPAGRLRSRTSDISDLLRGRHDPKTSTDSQPPPMPVPSHLMDPVTPPKSKGKFSFLGRKRKPSSVSPSSARIANDAAQRAHQGEEVPPVPTSTGNADASASHLPPAGRSGGRSSQKAIPASLPPLSVSPPSLGLPQLESNGSKKSAPSPPPPHQRIPSGIPTATLRNLRTQKSTSFDRNRQSTDSQGRKRSGSSARPIITISPPHSVAEGTAAFHAPRSAPRPPGNLASRRSSQSGLPTSASTLHDRPGPDSPTSEASSATSIQSSMQFPIPTADGPVTATSYKEESLLRKDHFEIGSPETQASQRRGTVSGINQSAPGSVGRSFMSDRQQQRRHVSVLHLHKLKQDIVATTLPSRVRRSGAHSDSPSTSGQSGNESTTSSQGTVSPISRSKSSSSPGAKKIPPPLMRTWHTPPTTGPPTEPLPSPPASATLQPLILSTSRSGAPLAPSPPASPQKTLPPLPPKDIPARTQGAKSPESLVSDAPPSPARSEPGSPPVRTPVREDAVKKVLADENATAEELREALKTQSAKYARLMSYLLTLTERHGMEKHEFLRRIEGLEQDARRRERELKGLRWLVANSSQSGVQAMKHAGGPARADSSTLLEKEPRSRQRSCSESAASAIPGLSPFMGARPGTCETVGRRSIESPAGSTEEGLFELQTTISEFIAPLVSPPLSDEEPLSAPRNGLPPTARLKRSNTLPDALSPLPTASSKQARRTSSPVLPVTTPTSSPETKGPQTTIGRSSARAGLGFGVDISSSAASSPDMGARGDRDRDPHARSDSSTLSSIPSLSTLHTSSSGLSSIPETPRTDTEFPPPADDVRRERSNSKKAEDGRPPWASNRRLSTSSLSSSTSSATGSYATSSRVSASPSIGQVLDRSRQPEMDAILRKLRAFGHHGSP